MITQKIIWPPVFYSIKAGLVYSHYLQDYIISYESKKKVNTNHIALFFKKLLINAPQALFLNIHTINELFLT